MFKNREIRVRVAKPEKAKDSAPVESKIFHEDTVQLVTEKSKDIVKIIAVSVVGVYAALKAIDTASQVIVKKTKSADNE